MNTTKPIRHRKKSTGSEPTKHRRTRSGCYTCRGRRVKCDEARPICERCRKGGRDCAYPEVSTSTRQTSHSSSKAAQAPAPGNIGSSSDEYDEEFDLEHPHLEAMLDADDGQELATNSGTTSVLDSQWGSISHPFSDRKSFTRQSSETSSITLDKGTPLTPSTESSVGYPYQTPGSSRLKQKASSSSWTTSDNLTNNWSHLPSDLQFYLNYFRVNVNHLHYSMKIDPTNFLKTLFLEIALKNEALLYGVVGFSAYLRTLHNPEGKIQDFLKYYNQAVSFLLKSLRKGEQRTVGTLLAILQLATIEEFLGDWVNLLGHQKAAYEILAELYTPQTIMENGMARIILGWYMRFDTFASLMSGFEMVLDRKWLFYAQEFFKQQIMSDPANLIWKIEHALVQLRLIAMDMSMIFAKNGKGEITHEKFVRDNEALWERLLSWKSQMDPALEDSRYLVTDFTNAPPLDPNDIVNPYTPGVIYSGPLFPMNLALVDWNSMKVMHYHQTSLSMKTPPSGELLRAAYLSCQIVETAEFWPGSPPGIILALQASLGIATLFLPRDHKHAMWNRRKLAKIEANGYIYPYTFRTKMSDLFRDRSCMHWWLPNDEGYSPIIRSVRKFVEERTSPATDLPKEDLREMKQIFSQLKLDGEPPNLPSNEDEGRPSPPDVTSTNASQNLAQDFGGNQLFWHRPER